MLTLSGGGGQGSGPITVDSAGASEATAGGLPQVFMMGGFVIGFGHSMLTDVIKSYNPDKGRWRKEPGLPTRNHVGEPGGDAAGERAGRTADFWSLF